VLEPVPVRAARSLGAEFVVAVDLLAHSYRHEANNKVRSSKKDEIEMQGPISAPEYIIKIWEKTYFGKQFNIKGRDKLYEPGILDIIQMTSLVAQRGMTKYRLKEHPPDFIVRPDVADVGMFDFHRGDSIIKIGEEAAGVVLPKLKEEINKRKSRRL
jgi:NTE family protein